MTELAFNIAGWGITFGLGAYLVVIVWLYTWLRTREASECEQEADISTMYEEIFEANVAAINEQFALGLPGGPLKHPEAFQSATPLPTREDD